MPLQFDGYSCYWFYYTNFKQFWVYFWVFPKSIFCYVKAFKILTLIFEFFKFFLLKKNSFLQYKLLLYFHMQYEQRCEQHNAKYNELHWHEWHSSSRHRSCRIDDDRIDHAEAEYRCTSQTNAVTHWSAQSRRWWYLPANKNRPRTCDRLRVGGTIYHMPTGG